jgi:choline dehydrogenase-like flavoprotein
MRSAKHIPSNPEHDEWDVIVVGTGMGGSTVGFELARLGRRVLFIEKGKFLHDVPSQAAPEHCSEAEARLLVGRWPVRLEGRTSFGPVEFHAPLGCGTGGSTALYGAQLERFVRQDFAPRANFPAVPDANLPEQWPISYDEMLPFYRQAEAQYDVCGTTDPLDPDAESTLREPPPLSERDQFLFDSFIELGLHPYRSHVGYYRREDCWECLDLCRRRCKSDAGTTCLLPALTQYGASILPECEVSALVVDRMRVRAVRASWRGRQLVVSAKIIVLACGALMTPVLLLRSRSPDWPDGVANSSGAVGRNLMLHTSDFVIVDQRVERSATGPVKAISANDFYFYAGKKLGTLQSVGLRPLPPFILGYLRYMEEKDPRWWRRQASNWLPSIADLAARWLRRASVFTTIVEDLPYPHNRVLLDASAIDGRRFEYSYSRELHRRNRYFRKQVARRLGAPLETRIVTGGRNNLNFGHACGTCRFGNDHRTSVLDATNRAHDLDNLYVVDASFFPSSGGTNPSLTIAANALRVGQIIDRHLQ